MRRYPFNMRAWVYWVLVFLVGGMLGNIPYIGQVLLVIALIAGAVLFFRTPAEIDRRFAPYTPVPVTALEMIGLPSSQEVVGESNYNAWIGQAVALAGTEMDAVLLWEPRNPFDPNAIRVDLVANGQSFTCGYLPRDAAPHVLPTVKAHADRGQRSATTARVYGGTPEKPNYGVWLNMSERSKARQ